MSWIVPPMVRHAAVVLAVACAAWQARAQQDPAATRPETLTVTGQLLRGTSRGTRFLAGEYVVLHQIAADGSGPLDSMRTGVDGRFRFRFVPRREGMRLVSARYAGIAYFSVPLGAASASEADVVVYDTSSGPVPIAVRGRHVIVSAPEGSGTRAVVEVFELGNESAVTRVAPVGGATFRSTLPAAALRPRVGEGEIAPAAVSFATGSLELRAPIAPGLKQLIVSYELPASAFPLILPVGAPVTVLEILTEEEGARASGAGLRTRETATVQGRQLQRWTAQDVDAAAAVTVELPPVSVAASRSLRGWIVSAIAAILALSSWWLVRQRASRRRRATAVGAAGHAAEELARRIAALDADFEGREAGAPAQLYHEERAALKAQLTALLARGPGAR